MMRRLLPLALLLVLVTTCWARKVIVDIDPSGLVDLGLDLDDDLALLTLLGSPQEDVQVVGVTVTFGNTLLASAGSNCRSLLRIAGKADSVPVSLGRDWWWNTWGGADAGNNTTTQAAQFIVDTVRDHPPHSVTVLVLGPLTNVAEAFRLAPDVAPRLQQLVAMGGDMHPNAVFDIDLNFILGDRQAAQFIFTLPPDQAPPATTVIPIQTCIQVAFTQTEVDALRACCPDAAACQHLEKLQKAILDSPPVINEQFRGEGYERNRSPRARQGFFPWDLVATMTVLKPDLFQDWRRYTVSVRGLQSYFTPVQDAAAAGDVASPTMVVDVPMIVADEALVLADVVHRLCALPHAEPALIGTDALLIPSNRRVFTALAATLAALALTSSCCFLRCCCRRR